MKKIYAQQASEQRPDTEFIKRMHDTLMHSFEDQLTEHIERLKNKFNQ